MFSLGHNTSKEAGIIIIQSQVSSLPVVPQPELMLTTTRGRATVAGLDSSQEYALRILVLNGTTEKLLAKRQFTSKKCSEISMINSQIEIKLLVDGKWRSAPHSFIPGEVWTHLISTNTQ